MIAMQRFSVGDGVLLMAVLADAAANDILKASRRGLFRAEQLRRARDHRGKRGGAQ
jgi:hypothetical protein